MGWLVVAASEALFELAQARLVLAKVASGGIPRLNRLALRAGEEGRSGPSERDFQIAEVSWLTRRVGARVPWRSDCLVQAIAAQRMLMRRGIAGQIVVGVENSGESGFGAHAWLACGATIVTGGDVARYTILLGEGEDSPP